MFENKILYIVFINYRPFYCYMDCQLNSQHTYTYGYGHCVYKNGLNILKLHKHFFILFLFSNN